MAAKWLISIWDEMVQLVIKSSSVFEMRWSVSSEIIIALISIWDEMVQYLRLDEGRLDCIFWKLNETFSEKWYRSWVTGIGIEVWLQESWSKLGYRNWDRGWVAGIEIEVDDRNWDWSWATGIGVKVGLQELRIFYSQANCKILNIQSAFNMNTFCHVFFFTPFATGIN